jgi:ubiquinone/menaquinone biosynthesis C-methylase UbiE
MKDKLNLGSGPDYREDYINLDMGNKDYKWRPIKTDINHDMNSLPYPFEDKQFSKIIMFESLQYIKDIDKFLAELNRISKPGAIIKFTVPYFSFSGTYKEFSIHKFCLNHNQLFFCFKKNGFKIISKGFKNNNKFIKWIPSIINSSNLSQNVYERFLSGILPVNRVFWNIKKVGDIT